MFNAPQKLAALPTDSPDDIAFKALYYQLLTGIAPPAGSGKAMPAQEQLLRSTANTTNTTDAAIAQSIVATYYYQPFNKNVPNAEQKSNNTIGTPIFNIVPNPANNIIAITYLSYDNSAATNVSIMDLYGRTVKIVPIHDTNTTIHITDLSSGVYFCQLARNGITIQTQKIVVLK